VPPGRPGSWEEALHVSLRENAIVMLQRAAALQAMSQLRGHRAIGVVYHPEAERGNYVPTILPRRYDALLYFDVTSPLKPLHGIAVAHEEIPETFPTGV